jgi:serine phosphatase RsbU (regulator of sigma subunit)
MSLPYSLDEIVRTSDESAVLTFFDERTTAALRILSLVFLILAVPFFLASASEGELFRMNLSALALLTSGALFLGLRRKKARSRLANFIRPRVRGVAMTFAIMQTTILLMVNAPSEGVVALAIMIQFAFVSFRLLPAEHVLLHASQAGISSVLVIFFLVTSDPRPALVMPVLVTNGVAMTLALLISRRVRRSITAQWTERRVSAREQIRMRDELRYARELQLSMLPECAPRIPWADLCAISIPATEVGGDYYDYFVDGDRVALVCGDVAGHGMASGLVLASMRSGFTLLKESLSNPAAVLRRLHDLISETSRRRMLVTVAVVLLDQQNRRATIASAGHPPVIVAHADGTIDTLNLYAPPLGVRLPVAIPQQTIDLRPGDVFVLHSDGIYETRNEQDETYGLERLGQIVLANASENAEALRNAIIADVERFRGSVAQDDDVTVVVAKIS